MAAVKVIISLLGINNFFCGLSTCSIVTLFNANDSTLAKLITFLWLVRVVSSAGTKGHILNLGHGVLVGTPEEAVAHFFDVARSFNFDSTIENHAVGAPNLVG